MEGDRPSFRPSGCHLLRRTRDAAPLTIGQPDPNDRITCLADRVADLLVNLDEIAFPPDAKGPIEACYAMKSCRDIIGYLETVDRKINANRPGVFVPRD